MAGFGAGFFAALPECLDRAVSLADLAPTAGAGFCLEFTAFAAFLGAALTATLTDSLRGCLSCGLTGNGLFAGVGLALPLAGEEMGAGFFVAAAGALALVGAETLPTGAACIGAVFPAGAGTGAGFNRAVGLGFPALGKTAGTPAAVEAGMRALPAVFFRRPEPAHLPLPPVQAPRIAIPYPSRYPNRP